jgi:magnesium transporter
MSEDGVIEREPGKAEDEDEEDEGPFSRDRIRQIEAWIESDALADIAELLAESHPSDIGYLLEQTDKSHRARLMEISGPLIDPETFTYLDSAILREALEILAPAELGKVLAELDSDDALLLIEELPEDRRREVIRQLSRSMRVMVEEGLTFPEESAGRLMQREFVSVPLFWTVGKTIDFLREAAEELPEEFHDIFVVDPLFKLAGVVHLNQILRSRRSTKIKELIDEDVVAIPADRDQEDVAYDFQRYSLSSAPVVDEEERIIGVITFDDIVDVVSEEAEEDILALGGVGESDIHRSVLATTRQRFSWLGVNLFTAIAASIAIGFFEATLEQIVALAVLMPIVASMGGNAGTQTLTVAVRALATRELSGANAVRVVLKETLVGMLNGVGFALLIAVIAGLWFQSPALALVIGSAMTINLAAAGLAGVLIPLGLERIGVDPAVASAVFLTTVTDLVGFVSFLGLATWLLI